MKPRVWNKLVKHPIGAGLLLLCMGCSHPAMADYRCYEAHDSLFAEVMADAGLPSCYRFLPMLLTDCDNAFSGDYARGLWALSVPAAHHYGLVVNDSMDERLDTRKAASAAAEYLFDLSRHFEGNDTLVLRQYALCVPVLRVGSDSLMWALQRIESEYEDGRRESTFLQPLQVANDAAERRDSLRKAELMRRAAELAERKAKAAQQPAYIIYKVKSGDYLGRIAQRNHVTVRQLMKWNNLKNDRIRDGQKLKIYKQ